jgi:predicted transcriptional regulator
VSLKRLESQGLIERISYSDKQIIANIHRASKDIATAKATGSSGVRTMRTAKDEVRELLENLPDDVSLEDIQHHLYVRQKIQKGLESAQQGRTLTHEEMLRRMSRWLEK